MNTERWDRLTLDRAAIGQLLQGWGMWRDNGDWARLRSAYTDDATMVVSWFDGSAQEFIEGCIRLREKSMRPETRSLTHHLIGGSFLDGAADRALAAPAGRASCVWP